MLDQIPTEADLDSITTSGDAPLRFLAIEQLSHIGELLDAQLPVSPLEDWSNPKLGVSVLLVHRPKIPYV